MANNRTKGHRVERLYAQKLRELGYAKTTTSRASSKALDNAKVDLHGLPFNIQIKAGYPKGINYPELLKEIREGVGETFPERLIYPNMIIHHKNVTSGRQRKPEDALVIMTIEDFYKILNQLTNGKT